MWQGIAQAFGQV